YRRPSTINSSHTETTFPNQPPPSQLFPFWDMSPPDRMMEKAAESQDAAHSPLHLIGTVVDRIGKKTIFISITFIPREHIVCFHLLVYRHLCMSWCVHTLSHLIGTMTTVT